MPDISDLPALIAAAAPPAGGAAIGQVIVATLAATIVTGILFALGAGHRLGRTQLLERAGAYAERQSGLPGWAALPAAVITGALLIALFGMLWDISIHIDEGRDEGPLANPAHYFILFGLFGVFAAGFLAIVMPKERPGPTAIRISGDWYAPLGGIMIAACGAFSLIGFPLDDVWHRLFGQDVTLWGPTHLMLIGGAAMTLIGLAVLLVEGGRANVEAGRAEGGVGWARWIRQVSLTGAFLLGLSTFQAEFDFGVPQFRFVFAPMLVMLAAGVALVAARIWLGPRRRARRRPVLHRDPRRDRADRRAGSRRVAPPLPALPAGRADRRGRRPRGPDEASARLRPRRRRCASAPSGSPPSGRWTQVFSPIAWPPELFPEGALLGFAMAIAGSLIGAWMGARLASDHLPRTAGMRSRRLSRGGSGRRAWSATRSTSPPTRACAPRSRSPRRPAGARATSRSRLDPPDAADDAEWLQAISWQGGGLVLDDLRAHRRRPAPTRPPSRCRCRATGRRWSASTAATRSRRLPIYLPADPAIPVDEVQATDGATREFVADHEILQREQQTAAGWLWAARLRRRARDHPRLPGAAGLVPAPPGHCGRAPAARAAPTPRRSPATTGGPIGATR